MQNEERKISKFKLRYSSAETSGRVIAEMSKEEAEIMKRVLNDATKQLESRNSYCGIVGVVD